MADAANNLASLYMRSGRFDEARELLDRARILLPDDETVAINSATVLLAQRGPAAAIQHLESFLAVHPEFRWMHWGETSLWFPGFRVYRQPSSLDWTPTLRELSSHLAARSR
jgi:tetratricopeptide (TPR) repeat protein